MSFIAFKINTEEPSLETQISKIFLFLIVLISPYINSALFLILFSIYIKIFKSVVSISIYFIELFLLFLLIFLFPYSLIFYILSILFPLSCSISLAKNLISLFLRYRNNFIE